jgi:hypothetical protein
MDARILINVGTLARRVANWVPCRVKVGPRMRLEGREMHGCEVLLKYTKKFLRVP